MSTPKFIVGLKDAAGDPITNMGANWTSKWYPFPYNHLSSHLKWSNVAIEGTLHLDYSSDPAGSISSIKNSIVLDGTFDETLFLDANLAINSYRLRFEHTSGAGTVSAFHNYKNSGV